MRCLRGNNTNKTTFPSKNPHRKYKSNMSTDLNLKQFDSCLKKCPTNDKDGKVTINYDCVVKCTKEFEHAKVVKDNPSLNSHHTLVVKEHNQNHKTNKDHSHTNTKVKCPNRQCTKSITSDCYIIHGDDNTKFKNIGNGNLYIKIPSCKKNDTCCDTVEIREDKEPGYEVTIKNNKQEIIMELFCKPNESVSDCHARHTQQPTHH